MEERVFEEFVKRLASSLNDIVFPRLREALLGNPSLREAMNPAFPFPRKLRIGALDTHLLVEYVGPEDPASESFEIEAGWQPGLSAFDFLDLTIDQYASVRIPITAHLENVQVFLGSAIQLLGDYLYDIVANPNDLILNGIPDFTAATDPIFVSNVTFLWSDSDGGLRIRHIDFLEVFPIREGGWMYHTRESFEHFARFLSSYEVPRYRPTLHAVLNEFIQLVAAPQSKETAITKYLTEHPEILQLALGANDINPQTKLAWQYPTGKPDLQPDFMPERMDGYADILEFKLPRLKTSAMVGTTNRSQPSFEIDAALAQIDEYEEWCSQEVNRRWLEAEKSIRVLSPHTYLVIGHRDDFSASDRQRLRGRRNATIFTYDEFVAMARMQLYRVR